MNNAVESQISRPALPVQTGVVCAAGTPGRLTEWGFRLIEEAGHAFGRPFTRTEGGLTAPNALILSTAPDAAFREAAGAGQLILFIGDPLRDISYYQQMTAQSQSQALKVSSAAAAMICEAARHPRAVVIRERGSAAPAAIARILGALGFPTSGAIAAGLIERFAGQGEATLARAIERFPIGAAPGVIPALGEAMATLVKKTVAPMFLTAATGKPQPIVWPRSVFFNGDRMGEPALPWVEVAGGARILYYGPYLHIPRGLWTVSSTVCFSDDLETTAFSIEVVWGTTPLGRGRVKPKKAGTFYAAFDVEVPSSDLPIEVRISTDQGSIFGRMALIDVAFRPTDTLTRPGEPSD